MINVLTFLDNKIYNDLKDIIFINANDIDEAGVYFDVVLFTPDSILEFNDYLELSLYKKIYKILLLKSKNDTILNLKLDFDETYLLNDIDKLPVHIKSIEPILKLKREIFEQDMQLQQIKINNKVHIVSLDMVKSNISISTKKLEHSFEQKIASLKNIISLLDSDDSTKEGKIKEELELISSDLLNYVSILQCEDRIFQILDAITLILKHDSNKIKTNSVILSERVIKSLKKELIPFYTIQEQRDYVLGLDTVERLEDDEAGKVIIF